MFGKVRKSEQLEKELEGDQETMFSRESEEEQDPFEEKTEKISGKQRKIKSLFQGVS